jgi:hypothetical protein
MELLVVLPRQELFAPPEQFFHLLKGQEFSDARHVARVSFPKPGLAGQVVEPFQLGVVCRQHLRVVGLLLDLADTVCFLPTVDDEHALEERSKFVGEGEPFFAPFRRLMLEDVQLVEKRVPLGRSTIFPEVLDVKQPDDVVAEPPVKGTDRLLDDCHVGILKLHGRPVFL